MKKLFPLLFVTLLFANCKEEDTVLFEMAYQAEFTIPAGINPFERHYFYIRDIPVGSYLSANGVTADDLQSINPGTARLSTIFSGTSSYEFIREVSIRIYTDDEDNWKEVFWRNQIPLNQGEDLDVFGTLIDARHYFGNQRLNIIVVMDLQGAPQQTTETRLTFNFQAK